MKKWSGFLAKLCIVDMDFYLEKNFKLVWEAKLVSKPYLQTAYWNHLCGLEVAKTIGFPRFWASTQSRINNEILSYIDMGHG